MGRNYLKIFKGLYFVIGGGGPLSSETYVFPVALNSMTKDRGRRVMSGNVDFDRFFTVYTTVPEDEGELLTPDFLKRAVAYRESYREPIYFAFLRDEVHVALSHRRAVFEPPVYRTILDFDLVAHCFQDLNLALDVAGLSD